MSTPAVLVVYGLLCAGAFAIGWRIFRAKQHPEGVTPEQAKRFGRLLMMAATALLILPVAFWLHGDLRLGRG